MEKDGFGVSEGIVRAVAYVYRHEDIPVTHSEIDPDPRSVLLELLRYSDIKESLKLSYQEKAGSSEKEQELLSLHLELLSDPEFDKQVKSYILHQYFNAAWAVESAADIYIGLLEASEDEYMRERVADLKDIKEKLLLALLGRTKELKLKERSILIADYLLPTEMLSLDKTKLAGVATESGGKTSHVAILCRSLEIPAVMGLVNVSHEAESGNDVILDGNLGKVIISPSSSEIESYEAILKEEQQKQELLHKTALLPSVTVDGRRITLRANIEGLEGIESAEDSGAEGIGLFRTEFLFLQKRLFKDEAKKALIYKTVAKSMNSTGPVVFRTLDVGGDKANKDLMSLSEDNPYLGCRSIRFCMENPEIFHNQLVSILKASAEGNVEVMFPMVSGIDELREVLAFFESVKCECRERGIAFDENIKVGTMIEVPSAAIMSDEICRLVDFISIGTNDLVQYTIAVDRGNESVAHLYRPTHPAVIRLMWYTLSAAERRGKEVSICGEMAGETEYLPLLIGLGFTVLSMSPHSILEVRKRIRELSYSSCKELADRILGMTDLVSIERELKDFNNKI